MSISEAFQSYANDVIVFKNQSKKTEENHFIVMKALISHFGDVEIESLTFPMVRDWKAKLVATRSDATVRNYIIKLRIVLDYLHTRGVDCLSPESIPVPKRADKVPVYLTKEQVAQCITATKKLKNKAIVSLLYSSGIRISELCSLDRGQIKDGRFTIVGKGGKARLCFIDARTQMLLDWYLAERDDNNPALFVCESGTRIRPGTIQETFKTIRKQTGLDVHPHTLRHSFATNLLSTNTNLYHVSRMLGHQQLNTTATYLHVVDHDLQEVYMKHHTV
jgi:site-specific recombinase XerD